MNESVRTQKDTTRTVLAFVMRGGLDCHGHPADTRTEWQIHSMRVLILALLRDYPGCRVCGHRDLSPDLNGNGEIEPEEWIKACPCFEVKEFCSKCNVLYRKTCDRVHKYLSQVFSRFIIS